MVGEQLAFPFEVEKVKRVECMVQPPAHFEVAPCPDCGDYRFLEWSEFVGHLWCTGCMVDFKPNHWGLLDGPVGVPTSKLLGIDLRMYNIETGKILEEKQ